jgi:predicted dehydrogenase
MGKSKDPWDPRKYIEYRLFWPYSSGIPGQWMSHQIDTVHWFSGLSHPRSVVANGGVYVWKDGRTNADTLTAVFEYGPLDDPTSGFQVVYSSRLHNSAGGTKEIFYSNGGMLDLDTNRVTPHGGLGSYEAATMGLKPNMVETTSLNSGSADVPYSSASGDVTTSAHMRNWLDCLRTRKTPHADITAGYSHSIADIMVTAALHTGERATFDEKSQEVVAGGNVF